MMSRPATSPWTVMSPTRPPAPMWMAVEWSAAWPRSSMQPPQSALPADAQRQRRHGLCERHRGRQALTDPLQVALRGAELLDQSLGVSLRAGLVCFAQFVLGVIA